MTQREIYNAHSIPFLGPEIYDGIELRGHNVHVTGWNCRHRIFADLIEKVKPRTIVEVGTWMGGSALWMAELTKDLGTRIFCVDTWLGGDGHVEKKFAADYSVMRDSHGWPQCYYQFLTNAKASGHHARITPIPMMSAHGARLLYCKQVEADLIYIDAGHQEWDVAWDVSAYFPLLAPGGVMFGDDWTVPGVRVAVQRFALSVEKTHELSAIDEKWVLSPR